MRLLQIVRSAYRCNLEEQDDPVVWITRALAGAGADLAVLLRGNAVNYALRGQDAAGLVLGGRAQAHPPALERDLAALVGGGTGVYAVREDLEERGLADAARIEGVELVPRSALPELLGRFDLVWHW
jgi:sulfur relay (sulfurtransferase) DsrF/TusC family protein